MTAQVNVDQDLKPLIRLFVAGEASVDAICEVCGRSYNTNARHSPGICPSCAESYFEICPDCGYLQRTVIDAFPKCSSCVRRKK